MKKYYLLIVTIFTAFMLTACGMTSEDITAYMTSLDVSYQSGAYEQAQSEIEKLDKAYKKMTDDQKSEFNELRSSVQYAIESASAINAALDNVQSMLDLEQYYEASAELDIIAGTYNLPPAEQSKFDEKKSAADAGVQHWEAAELLQNVESLLNSGDYDAASAELYNVNTSILSEGLQETYKSLQIKISDAKSAAEAEARAASEAKAAAEAKAEAERKANEGISASQARAIAADAFGMSVSSITITDNGSYYRASGEEWDDDLGFKDEAGCKIDKKTGNVYDRVG